jgi:hypothetical protein
MVNLTQFCDLPLELRNENWTLTLTDPPPVLAKCFLKVFLPYINPKSRPVAPNNYESVPE